MFRYTATHVSKSDGSDAMKVADLGDLIVLVNEDGMAWTDPAEEWEAIS
jgi:hypothetical protein